MALNTNNKQAKTSKKKTNVNSGAKKAIKKPARKTTPTRNRAPKLTAKEKREIEASLDGNSKFKVEYITEAYKLASEGCTNRQIANLLGVSEQAFYGWIKRYDKLNEALAKGKTKADTEVVAALHKRATGFYHKDTHFAAYQGEIISEKYDRYIVPDTGAASMWLKNRMPNEWRDKQIVEHQGTINYRDVDVELTEEEEAAFAKSLLSTFEHGDADVIDS